MKNKDKPPMGGGKKMGKPGCAGKPTRKAMGGGPIRGESNTAARPRK